MSFISADTVHTAALKAAEQKEPMRCEREVDFYRKAITEIVNMVEDVSTLKRLYNLASYLYTK